MDVADANAIEEISLAYEKVKEVDALEISDEGQEQWDSALRRYNERIEKVEARMTSQDDIENLQELFEEWSRKVGQKNLQNSGKIFLVDTIRLVF